MLYVVCIEFRVPFADTVMLVELLLEVQWSASSAVYYSSELPDLERAETDFSNMPHLEGPGM